LRQAIRNFRSDRIEDCRPAGLWFKGEGDRLRQVWVDGWEINAAGAGN
jgi:predicted DNA-binding transcriptional regulator YafY